MTEGGTSIISWSPLDPSDAERGDVAGEFAAGSAVRITLPGKLNLFLEILGRRDDGYHELITLMTAIDLADELLITESTTGRDELEVVGFDAGADADNLVLRALAAMRSFGDIPPQKMRLTKRIPPGSGLGGGSSDAAGVLLYLDDRYTLGRDRDLSEVAAALGSDVPFFLGSGAAVATGRGENIEPFAGSLFGGEDVAIALLLPDLHSSSAAAYRHVTLPLTSPDGPISFEPQLFTNSRTWVSALFNRLESAVLASHPQLQSLAQWLAKKLTERRESGENLTGAWRMTGSGSAFYVVCREGSEAHSVVEAARREMGVNGCVVRPLS